MTAELGWAIALGGSLTCRRRSETVIARVERVRPDLGRVELTTEDGRRLQVETSTPQLIADAVGHRIVAEVCRRRLVSWSDPRAGR